MPTLRALFQEGGPYRATFIQLDGRAPETVSDESLLVFVAKLLAAYQETLISPASAFDKFRIGLLSDNMEAIAAYPLSARKRLKLFVGKGQCGVCHFGPAFTHHEFNSPDC